MVGFSYKSDWRWPIYWYGLFYLLGALIAYVLAKKRLCKQNKFQNQFQNKFSHENILDEIINLLLSGILGGVFFTVYFILQENIFFTHGRCCIFGKEGCRSMADLSGGSSIFFLSQSGVLMSFGGGVCLVPLCATWYCSRRVANLINGELYGRPTTVVWGMIDPRLMVIRHPSVIYEFILVCIILWPVVWRYSNKSRAHGCVSG